MPLPRGFDMLRRLLVVSLLLLVTVTLVGAVAAWPLVRRWDTVVSERFRTYRWNFPSKIYSDSLLVYPGMDLKGVGFFARLRGLGYQHVEGEVARKGDYSGTRDGQFELFLHDSPYASMDGAGSRIRLSVAGDILTRLEDAASHEELYAIEIEPELISGLYEGNWEERHLVTLDAVSPWLLRAIIDVEDQRFYSHYGIDLLGIMRALWVDLRHGRLVQGGSTLTQQLMKNFFLSEERSIKRKLAEILMALIIEHRFSKEQILTNYVNEIYLGQKGAQGIFGVWEASQFYFAKDPKDLSIAEAATLAGLIKAPNRYSPFRNPDAAQRRRNYALKLMRQQGDITTEEYEAAIQEPLRVVHVVRETKDAPYFVDFVRHELSAAYPIDVLTTEGLRIYTSVDMHLQRLAEQSLQAGLAALERRWPRLRTENPRDQLQACLIAVQPQTGSIKAMMGGRDYRSTQFNRCTQAVRQPGSVFKPFTYLAAFEQTRHREAPIRPTTWIEDVPFDWSYEGQVWAPANYRKEYLGQVSVRQALERSLNAATARLAYEVGLAPIIDTARRMGIHSPLPPYPSVVLGAAEVTPIEVAQAFAVLANSGLRTTPLAIKKVMTRDGEPVERNPVQAEQVVPADTAYLVTHLLEGVLDRGTARSVRNAGFSRPAAGKTGTTNDYSDAWFAGFTPSLVTVVWVGFDQRRPLHIAGAEAALPIWTDFMKQATAWLPATQFTPPPGIALVRIDPASGELATADCPRSLDEAFYEGQQPTVPCSLHSTTHPEHGVLTADLIVPPEIVPIRPEE